MTCFVRPDADANHFFLTRVLGRQLIVTNVRGNAILPSHRISTHLALREERMYCSNCGKQAQGNFCASCGARLTTGAGGVAPPSDGSDEVQYQRLLQIPAIRDQIAQHAALAKPGITAEQFLEVYDLALSPLTGVSIGTVAKIAVPIYSRLGIRTGKTRRERIPRPVGHVLTAALCSLARRGQVLQHVHQAQDGCVLEAQLPSDLWSFEGKLVVSIARATEGASIEASTEIPGQLFDWGKSQRCLNLLVDDLRSL